MQRICSESVYLKKKLSLFEEVEIFSIISFKIGFIGIVKDCYFPVFWNRTSCMGYVNCESAKEMARIRLFEKSCHYLKKLQFLYNQFLK